MKENEMKKTMVRQADNDFEALLMCNAMEMAGGEPFSVVAVAAYKTARYPHYDMPAKWHVFGRVDESRINEVDDHYDALKNPAK